MPPPPEAKVLGDEALLKENSDLRLEKKILQQELALTRAQGDALRMAIENRTSDGDTATRLVDKLNETSKELAELRASYAKLLADRSQDLLAVTETTGLKAQLGAAEEKLATTLRGYTELQEEVSRLKTEVATTRTENVALSEQVKTITAENKEAQTALAQLNQDLLAQKEARTRAEQDAETLRTELKTAAPNATALAQQRTGSAPDARTLVAEHAAEAAALKEEVTTLRSTVQVLTAELTEIVKREDNALAKARLNRADAVEQPAASASPNVVVQAGETSRSGNNGVTRPPNGSLSATLVTSSSSGSSAPRIVIPATGEGPGSSSGTGAAAGRVHVVASGDTLAKISTRYFGVPDYWSNILSANRDVLGENNNLVIGRSLRIPSLHAVPQP
ncbi:MAG: LysM peptidoglycan-binding domain-containing protein [Verrucomicrobiota bacterium]